MWCRLPVYIVIAAPLEPSYFAPQRIWGAQGYFLRQFIVNRCASLTNTVRLQFGAQQFGLEAKAPASHASLTCPT